MTCTRNCLDRDDLRVLSFVWPPERIAMKTGIDPCVDYAFKRVFGSERNMRILTDFVRAVLRTGNQTISELLLLNPFNEMEFADDKLSIFDIKARDQTGQQVNIEMQLFGFHVFLQRVTAVRLMLFVFDVTYFTTMT